MRDYTQIDRHLDRLIKEVYPQPQDPGHTGWANEAVAKLIERVGIRKGYSVLDLGCGEAFLQELFEYLGYAYLGVCLGEDYKVAMERGRNVIEEDFTFLPFKDDSFDVLFSRHSLEHSPMPLLTLMEWRRITKRYIALVLPSPVFWEYRGVNHYFVLNEEQWRHLFETVGLEVTFFYSKQQNMTTDPTHREVEIEYWFLLEKK